jgi:hypothetical protein
MPFEIRKGGLYHLVNDYARSVYLIDVVQLSQDLKKSYLEGFKPVADGTVTGPGGENSLTMQQRLDEVISENNKATLNHAASLAVLPHLPPGAVAASSPGGGGVPSGSLPPVPPIPPTPANSSSLK